LLNRIVLLFLHWFFIGYWILKTGLDVYPGPFFLRYNRKKNLIMALRAADLWSALFGGITAKKNLMMALRAADLWSAICFLWD